ncbi:hypothetical protein GJ496_010502 [Pomphorhynchus laevis]|nr:hypothetical protein GJ496_010502 [Pomphorhynchus laevis]
MSERSITISWSESNEGGSPEPGQPGMKPCLRISHVTFKAMRRRHTEHWKSMCLQLLATVARSQIAAARQS